MKKRKVRVRTIGKTKILYKEKKPKSAKCGMCGKKLAGVPRASKAKIKNMPKTSKRPSRPYGGVLCPKCLKDRIREEVRKNV